MSDKCRRPPGGLTPVEREQAAAYRAMTRSWDGEPGRPSLTDLDIARVSVDNALSGAGDVEAAAGQLAAFVTAYVRREMTEVDAPPAGRCVYCLTGQPAVALEPVNTAGNLACRDSGACQVRAALNTDGRDVPEQMGDIAAVLNQLARNADNGLFPSQVASALREIATHVTALAAQVDPEVVAVQPPPEMDAYTAGLAARKQRFIDQINAAPDPLPAGDETPISYQELKAMAAGEALDEIRLFDRVRRLTVPHPGGGYVPPVIGWWDSTGRTHCLDHPIETPGTDDTEIDAGNSAAIGCRCDTCQVSILAAALARFGGQP